MSFTINYKGTSCRGTKFLYKCSGCAEEQEVIHAAAEEPTLLCGCGDSMHKKPTAPALDAELHERMMSFNLGVDSYE